MADTDITEPWFPVEESLKHDTTGEARDALFNKLQEQAQAIKSKMDAGVPQAEFAQLQKVHNALDAASQIVTLIWGRYHRVS